MSSEKVSGTLMECPKCKSPHDGKKKYCADCGAPLDPIAAAVSEYLGSNLRVSVQSLIKEVLKDQQVVEVEITTNVVEKIAGWLEVIVFFVGISVGLFFLIRGYIGI